MFCVDISFYFYLWALAVVVCIFYFIPFSIQFFIYSKLTLDLKFEEA